MISVNKFYGGSKNLALAADRMLHPGEARVYYHSSGNFEYLLPQGNAPGVFPGGPVLIIINASGALRTIKDYLGNAITTMANGTAATICLVRGTTTGIWSIDIRPLI